jgi:hypothetical protein
MPSTLILPACDHRLAEALLDRVAIAARDDVDRATRGAERHQPNRAARIRALLGGRADAEEGQ